MNNDGIAFKSALTTFFMPSFFETSFNGLNALSALKALTNVSLGAPLRLFKRKFRIDMHTIVKSRILKGSFKYECFPIANPRTKIFKMHSAINTTEIIKVN